VTYLDSKKLQGVKCVVDKRSFVIIGFIDNGRSISSEEMIQRIERDLPDFKFKFKDYKVDREPPTRFGIPLTTDKHPVVIDKPRRAKPSDLGLEKPPGKYQRRKESKFKYAGGARGSSGAKVKL